MNKFAADKIQIMPDRFDLFWRKTLHPKPLERLISFQMLKCSIFRSYYRLTRYNYGRLSIITMNCHLDHQDIRMFLLLFPIIIKLSNILKYFHCLFSLCIWSCSMEDCYFNYFQLSKLAPSNLSHLNQSYWVKIEHT